MNIITRRGFIKRSLYTALGTALGSLMNVPGFLRSAMADGQGITWNGKKMLFIFMRGGNDGLNTIIPTGDPAYGPAIRPNLAVAAPAGGLTSGGVCPDNPDLDKGIDLGNSFASLHPGLVDVCPIYNAGQLACIHRVGYPHQSRSHFDSQRYWETGFPNDDSDQNGILYRTIVETGFHKSQVLPCVSLNDTMPLLIKGDVPFTNINDPTRFDLLGVYAAARQKHIDAISRMHGMPHASKNHRDLLFPTGERFVNSIDQVSGIDFEENESSEFIDDVSGYHLFQTQDYAGEKLFNSGSARSFFKSLKYSAQILAETDAVIAGTEMSGFDTHGNQGDTGPLDGDHAEHMAWLGWGMYALYKYLSHPSIDMWDDTVVVTMTEFGRTTIENGSFGTDHAEAGAMFVAGGPVNGGVYGCSLADSVPWMPGVAGHPDDGGGGGSMYAVSNRYLHRACDYRSILGELIRDHLGAGQDCLNRIIPAYTDPAEALLSGGLTVDGTNIMGELGLI